MRDLFVHEMEAMSLDLTVGFLNTEDGLGLSFLLPTHKESL